MPPVVAQIRFLCGAEPCKTAFSESFVLTNPCGRKCNLDETTEFGESLYRKSSIFAGAERKLYFPMADCLIHNTRCRRINKCLFPAYSAALKKDGERHPLNLLRKLKIAPSLHFPLVTLRSPSPFIFIIQSFLCRSSPLRSALFPPILSIYHRSEERMNSQKYTAAFF